MTRLAAGTIVVIAAWTLVSRVIGHQGIDVSRRDTGAETGPAKPGEVIQPMPIRLRNHAHAVTAIFQEASNHGGAVGRMIHIGVAGDEQHIEFAPPPAAHFFRIHGKELEWSL